MTLYELIHRLLHWEAEQTVPPSHLASAVEEAMRQNQHSCQKDSNNSIQKQDKSAQIQEDAIHRMAFPEKSPE